MGRQAYAKRSKDERQQRHHGDDDDRDIDEDAVGRDVGRGRVVHLSGCGGHSRRCLCLPSTGSRLRSAEHGVEICRGPHFSRVHVDTRSVLLAELGV
eukprot:4107844-Prymnesium_polylepis.1